jgi:hypothetical protein
MSLLERAKEHARKRQQEEEEGSLPPPPSSEDERVEVEDAGEASEDKPSSKVNIDVSRKTLAGGPRDGSTIRKGPGDGNVPATDGTIAKADGTIPKVKGTIPSTSAPVFKKPEHPAPKKSPSSKQVTSKDDSDTDCWENNASNHFRKIEGMIRRDRSISVDRDFMYDTVPRMAERIRTKSKAKERVTSQGMAAVSELLALEERVSDKTYANALNYLIHFATPGECIKYLFANGIKMRPDNTIISDSKVVNGANCVRKRMNLLGDAYQTYAYTPVDDGHEEVLKNWIWETDFKISKWNQYLVRREELYQGGLTDVERDKPTTSTPRVRGPPAPAPAKVTQVPSQAPAAQRPAPSFVSGGIQAAADTTVYQPGINYATQEKMEQAPLTVDECLNVDQSLIDRITNPNRPKSMHDDEVVAAMAGLNPDVGNKAETVLMAERKLQREEHQKFMNKLRTGDADPDGIIMPPLDASDLLGGSIDDEMDPRFLETLGERYKKTLEEYIAFKVCANRLVKSCLYKDNSDKPAYIPYLNRLKTSIINHFTRLSAYSAFNLKSQTTGMMDITQDIEKCVKNLQEAKMFPEDVDNDPADKNVKEYSIDFVYPDGSINTEIVVLPKGWDDPLLPEGNAEAEQWRQHHILRCTGTFDGTEPHTLNQWWGIFKDKVHRVPGVANCDKWEHIVENELFTGPALAVFLGGSKRSKNQVVNKDHDYVYGISRVFTQYDRADNKWDSLLLKLDKVRINQENIDEIKDGIYELEQLTRDLKASKPKGKTNDEVARMIHIRRREIFTPNLLETIDNHLATASIQKHLQKGHYNFVLNSYLTKIMKNVGSKTYSATFTRRTRIDNKMEELIKILDESKRKASGFPSRESSPKRVKFSGAATAKTVKADPTKTESKQPLKPAIKKEKPVFKKLNTTKLPMTKGFKKVGLGVKDKAKAAVEEKKSISKESSTTAAAMTDIHRLFEDNLHALMQDEEFEENEEESQSEEVSEEEEQEVDAGGDEVRSEIANLKGQVQALIQVASVNSIHPEAMIPLQKASINTAQTSNTVQQTTDLVKIMKNINIIKGQTCFFTHRSTEPVQHKLWDCALGQNSKSEELGERNQCRFCWQIGHLSKSCTVKVPMVCDFCKKTGHWKPFCGQFINKAYQSYNEKINKNKEAPTAAVTSEETPEQFSARVTNQAIHEARVANASAAMLSHYSLTGGVPLGHAPQPLLNQP